MTNIESLNQRLYNIKPSIYNQNCVAEKAYHVFRPISKDLTDEEIKHYTDINGRKHIHQYFMDIAYKIAERSTCIKRQVGAIIVKDMKIVSCGYNGISKGLVNCTEDTCILKPNGKCGKFPIHAEVNSCLFATPEERKNATMYITCQACSNCAAIIANSGITRVIYDQRHAPEYNILNVVGIEELWLIDAIRQDLYYKEKAIYEKSLPIPI